MSEQNLKNESKSDSHNKTGLLKTIEALSKPILKKTISWPTLSLKVIIALLVVIGYFYKIQLEKKYEKDIILLEKKINDSEIMYNKTLESLQKSTSILINTMTEQLKNIEEHNENLNRHNRILLEQNQKLGQQILEYSKKSVE